jgi:hypothetical protein
MAGDVTPAVAMLDMQLVLLGLNYREARLLC